MQELNENCQIITIDGPAGSGKSTIARALSEELGCQQLDSGAIYRMATYLALKFAKKNDIPIEQVPNEAEFQKGLESAPLELTFENKKQQLHLAGFLMNEELRTPEITQNIKPIADSLTVRNWVNQKLRESIQGDRTVLDGRDMGTQVFPQADIKIYLTASLEERANRRHSEQKASGNEQTLESIKEEMEQRDHEDQNREFGALKKPDDALMIDSTNMSKEDVVQKIQEYISEKGTAQKPDVRQTDRSEPSPQPATQPVDSPSLPTPSSFSVEEDASLSMEELMTEEHLNISDVTKGSTVKGKVLRQDPSANPQYILVDLNSKSEGAIPIEEFDEIPKEGSEVKAIVNSFDQETGLIQLSKRALDIRRAMDLLEKAYRQELPVTGEIKKKLAKGYMVEIEKLEMFLPHSQIGSLLQERAGNHQKSLLGNTYTYQIIELNSKRNTGVVSRKKWQDSQNRSHWESLLQKIEIGAIVEGKVLHHVQIGVFVQVENVVGFLHRSNISWGKLRKKIEEVYPVGSEIKVRVLEINHENMKLSLGLKQLIKDPWENILDDLRVGSTVKGKVSYLAGYGAFVDLENEIEGFVPISEISWMRKIGHPKETLSIGDEIEVKVLGINAKDKKLTLGIKQLQRNPWDDIKNNVKVGDVRKGKIKYIAPYGMFVQITDEIDGLVRREDVSWKDRFFDLSKTYKKNEQVDFKITHIDEKDRRVGCSIKHLLRNPYQEIRRKYSNKTPIDGKVLKVMDSGVLVVLSDDDLTGFAHTSEIPRGTMGNINKGDEIKVIVKNVDPKNERISLSIKAVEHVLEKVEMGKYIEKKDQRLTDNPFSKLREMVSETK